MSLSRFVRLLIRLKWVLTLRHFQRNKAGAAMTGIALGTLLLVLISGLALIAAYLHYGGENHRFAFLMWGLWILLAFLTVNLFVSIKSATQRIMSGFGVLLFTGYLLFDFNRINRLKDVEQYDNWNQALGLAISIYLDIINLFLHLLRLLSKK